MEQGFKAASSGVKCALMVLCLCFACSCGQSAGTAEVGFILVLADETRGPMNPRDALDRTMVVEVTCQVFIPETATMFYQTFSVDPGVDVQEGHLYDLPPGTGYFARILGLTAERSVYQCGASGPFVLEPGEKEFVTIAIERPPVGNEYCEAVCQTHEDCGPGFVCPSPCAAGDFSQPCTPALCRPG